MTRTALLPLALATGCITELPEVERPCEPWDQPGIYALHLDVAGYRRKAFVYVPPDSAGPRDLAVVLHGAGGNARHMAETTEYIPLARKEGFVVAFPEALDPLFARPAWNAGDCCLTADEEDRDTPDVQFMEALVAELADRTCTDRVLATGFSNGAMLVHRWACQKPTVDVAVPVGGTPAWDRCVGPPIPIRHYHGTDDPIVRVDGGGLDDRFPPLFDAFTPWLERNRCAEADPEIARDGTLSCHIYDCAAPTEICLIDGWMHRWPGGIYAGETGGVNATVDGWAFFQAHAPPRPPDDTSTHETTQ